MRCIAFFIVISVFTYVGCAEMKDQRENGSITFAPEAEANARMNNIDQSYVNNWLKAHHTTAEELLGKTYDEGRAVLGRGFEADNRPGCEPGKGMRAALAKNPNDKNVAYQVKYWCDEDHQEWMYNIPRWFYLNGNTLCIIMFENGKVISVGNTTSKIAKQSSNEQVEVPMKW